jgi:hypothetical protein
VRRFGARAFVGEDIHNANGVNQSLQVGAGASPTRFELRVQNDGDLRESFVVRGTGSDPRFTVRYLRGATDVTAQVVAGTFGIRQLAPGDHSPLITMVVTPRSSARIGSVRSLPVTFRSTLEPDRPDMVIPQVRRLAI